MKTAFIFMAIAALLMILVLRSGDLLLTPTSFDIHLHDTYFIIDHLHFAILILLVLGTAFTLGGMIGTRFLNKYFIGFFLACFLADAYIAWQWYATVPA